ncbi:MAG: response regulator [Desulfobacterales bacterium]|nr:response regulator [Desulfobacterales bacterium]
MGYRQRRYATRSRAWPETKAYLEFGLPDGHDTIKKYRSSGDVRDIGACGMFLNTRDFIPVTTHLDITICFDENPRTQKLSINAGGQVVRSCRDGVGIRFTSIDLNRFLDCLIEKINRTPVNEITKESEGVGGVPDRRAAERPIEADLEASETVLVAEDDEAVRKLVFTMLQQQGYTVLMGENGKKALAALEHHEGPLHLLLTDVDMPDMNGKELFEKVSSSYPDASVLYMSGCADNIVADQCLTKKKHGFLLKPFSVKALAAKIQEVLG